MPEYSPQRRISLLIRAKRREDNLGLREAAADCGISAATLSRLERGTSPQLPDASTLTKLAKWLGTTLNDLFNCKEMETGASTPEPTTPEFVEVHLRADKNLAPETADALAKMFKQLYENVTQKPTG